MAVAAAIATGAKLVARTAVGVAKGTAKTTGKRIVMSGGKKVAIDIVPAKIASKTARRNSKRVIKKKSSKAPVRGLSGEQRAKVLKSNQRKETFDNVRKKGVKIYNDVKGIQEKIAFFNDMKNMLDGGDPSAGKKMAYYLRNYFNKMKSEEYESSFDAMTNMNDLVSAEGLQGGSGNIEDINSGNNTLKFFVVSSWQYYAEFLYNKGNDSNNTLGIMTIHLIGEMTNYAAPFIHANISLETFDEYLNAPSKGQYWWYQIRTGKAQGAQTLGCTINELEEFLDANEEFEVPGEMNDFIKNVKSGMNQAGDPAQFSRKYQAQSLEALTKHLDIGLPKDFVDKVMIETQPKETGAHTWQMIKRQNNKVANNLKNTYGIDVSDYMKTFNNNQNVFTKELFQKGGEMNALNNIKDFSASAWKETQGDFITKNAKNLIETKGNIGQSTYSWNPKKVFGSLKKFK